MKPKIGCGNTNAVCLRQEIEHGIRIQLIALIAQLDKGHQIVGVVDAHKRTCNSCYCMWPISHMQSSGVHLAVGHCNHPPVDDTPSHAVLTHTRYRTDM